MTLPLANIGIAITRPVDQAKNLSQLIEAAGGHVIPFPLIEIVPLVDYTQFNQVISNIQQYDWAIFISSNAVENGMPRLIKQGISKQLKFAAIGPTTAKALFNYGIQETLIPEGRFDSESLLSLPEMQDMQGKKILIVRGVGGRELLANTLKARGAQVIFAECYRRINPQNDCSVLEQAWNENRLHAIVVTSSEAMRYLLEIAGDSNWLKDVLICVNHTRISELFSQQNLKSAVASAPGDEAMINLIVQKTQKE
jgi:uroporphyrinogen-III synthase